MLKTFMGRDIIIKNQELTAQLIEKSTGAAAFFYLFCHKFYGIVFNK